MEQISMNGSDAPGRTGNWCFKLCTEAKELRL